MSTVEKMKWECRKRGIQTPVDFKFSKQYRSWMVEVNGNSNWQLFGNNILQVGVKIGAGELDWLDKYNSDLNKTD